MFKLSNNQVMLLSYIVLIFLLVIGTINILNIPKTNIVPQKETRINYPYKEIKIAENGIKINEGIFIIKGINTSTNKEENLRFPARCIVEINNSTLSINYYVYFETGEYVKLLFPNQKSYNSQKLLIQKHGRPIGSSPINVSDDCIVYSFIFFQ